MKGDGVFLIRGENDLVEMNSEDICDEKQLQKLIAKYPNLLAGGQIDPDDPRRWLLVGRELGLASEEDGSERWSVDHLFLDQDGIPTIVEVKRSSDTRIRREVVGQMLDYAANCVVYWPVDKLKKAFDVRVKNDNKDPNKELSTFLQGNIDTEKFWNEVEENLKDGRIRLLFVADEIPQELKSIVKFLNDQMQNTEVLAIQLKHYKSQDHRVIVPSVFSLKPRPPTTIWTLETFLEKLIETNREEEAKVVNRIYELCKEKGYKLSFSKRKNIPDLFSMFEINGEEKWVFTIWFKSLHPKQHSKIMLDFTFENNFINDKELMLKYIKMINTIPGFEMANKLFEKKIDFDVINLSDPDNLEKFLNANEWAIEQIKHYHTKKE